MNIKAAARHVISVTKDFFKDMTLFCPHCSAPRSAAFTLNPSRTMYLSGDLMICLDCGEPAIIHHDGTRRKPTPDEARRLNDDFVFSYLRDLIRAL